MKEPLDFTAFRDKKIDNKAVDQFYVKLKKIREHEMRAEERFLIAWKRGVLLLGLEFFNVECNIHEITDKSQLTPDIEYINQVIGGYSHGSQILLGLMCSFYNSEEGQKILNKVGAPNLIDALAIIDFNAREIIGELWLNYTGW